MVPDRMLDWLDTETRAILCPTPPQKYTEIATDSFSLLLIEDGPDHKRIQQVLAELPQESVLDAAKFPFILAHRLTYDEALGIQFALACCDCILAVVRDEVAQHADLDHLQEMMRQIAKSAEFSRTTVRLTSIPPTEEAHRFCWIFLGLAVGVHAPLTFRVFRKKARLMQHWATKTGIVLEVVS